MWAARTLIRGWGAVASKHTPAFHAFKSPSPLSSILLSSQVSLGESLPIEVNLAQPRPIDPVISRLEKSFIRASGNPSAIAQAAKFRVGQPDSASTVPQSGKPVQSKYHVHAHEAPNLTAMVGGHSMDVAQCVSAIALSPEGYHDYYGEVIKIHVESFPSSAHESLLAQKGTLWGQPVSLMPQARKAINFQMEQWRRKSTVVIPTEENVREFMRVLKDEGIDSAKRLGWYPQHQADLVEDRHSFLEEAIQRECMLQTVVGLGVYKSVVRVKSPVREIDAEKGQVFTRDGSVYPLGERGIKLVIDFTSELKQEAVFGSIPTKDMNALCQMSPSEYSGENLFLVGGGQSTSWGILYYLLKNPNPVGQIVIGVPPKGVPGCPGEPADFMEQLKAEQDPKKKLSLLFGGQVLDGNLDALLDAGIMQAIEQNKIIFLAQGEPSYSQVSHKDGLIRYSGTNLATGYVIDAEEPESTQLPIIAATGFHAASKVIVKNQLPGSVVITAGGDRTWHAPANLPKGSMPNQYHQMIKALGIAAPHEDIVGLPLNRFTEACKACYQQVFEARGLVIPDAFFSDLAQELRSIKTDTFKEAQKFGKALDLMLSKHLPGQEDAFKRIFAEVNFDRAERVHSNVDALWVSLPMTSAPSKKLGDKEEEEHASDSVTQMHVLVIGAVILDLALEEQDDELTLETIENETDDPKYHV